MRSLRTGRIRAGRPVGVSRATRGDARSPESEWFWQHYDGAANEIIETFAAQDLSLTNKVVADIGCGDGFTDLGLLHKAKPKRLVGFDLNLTDANYLQRRAIAEGVSVEELDTIEFQASGETHIPAGDGSFECAVSWSAFEHVSEPIQMLREIRRILVPDGVFFLQLWPFYMSARGSHLWEWFPEEFHHLQRPESAVVTELDQRAPITTEAHQDTMRHEFQHLSRLTVEELQRSVLAAGFVVRRVELLTGAVQLAPSLARYSWLDLAVSGIKLVATPH